MTKPKVEAGFVSFTEVTEGEHRSYNEWHLFDHLPEQLPLPGIVFGQRWVWTPVLRKLGTATAPLDRVHYATLYLLAAPVRETIDDFFALAAELRAKGRFHEHRISHLSGALAVAASRAAPRALVSPDAVPYRPNTGVHIRVEPRGANGTPADELAAVPGVAGAWVLEGDERVSVPATEPLRVTWCWLDGDVETLATDLAERPAAPGATFAGTLATVDPWGPWDWFDGE